eukprot:Gb_02528 [translate_table: standard]
MATEKNGTHGLEASPSPTEQQDKINELRTLLGPLSSKSFQYCSDAALARYLRARNWNVNKANKLLKETLKWRAEYKPENVCWEDVAREAETGKTYRASYADKYRRSVLVLRPGCQNTTSTKGQIRFLVYCMENAILNLAPGQEQMVWLIDFKGWNISNVSLKAARETAHILQDCYPERLGLAILYNPPKLFESFWTVVKPFLEVKTAKKVKFVYSNDAESTKIMEELFNMDELECAFGGKNVVEFNKDDYGQRMREDDKKTALHWNPAKFESSSDGCKE